MCDNCSLELGSAYYSPSSDFNLRVEPMSPTPTQSAVPLVITPTQPDTRGRPLSRFLKRLGDVTRVAPMDTSLFVQIGVLNYQSWTIASATGERQTNASLTLAMPRGPLFQMHRIRKGLSKSPSLSAVEQARLKAETFRQAALQWREY